MELKLKREPLSATLFIDNNQNVRPTPDTSGSGSEIYEIHIFELLMNELINERPTAVIYATKASAERKPEKNSGFNVRTMESCFAIVWAYKHGIA